MSAQQPPVPPMVADEFTGTGRLSDHHARLSRSSSLSTLKPPKGFRAGVGLKNVARRTLGIVLLLVTVFLWTASNFLASVCYSICLRSQGRISNNRKPSIYSPTILSQSRTSLHTSTRPCLLSHSYLSSSALRINMALPTCERP